MSFSVARCRLFIHHCYTMYELIVRYIVKVDYVKDRGKGNRHEVHLEDQTNKQLYVVPWQ